MRGFFQWACEALFIESDPTAGVKGIPTNAILLTLKRSMIARRVTSEMSFDMKDPPQRGVPSQHKDKFAGVQIDT
jgi:hypothetical protein